jgi:hypothetical protein
VALEFVNTRSCEEIPNADVPIFRATDGSQGSRAVEAEGGHGGCVAVQGVEAERILQAKHLQDALIKPQEIRNKFAQLQNI